MRKTQAQRTVTGDEQKGDKELMKLDRTNARSAHQKVRDAGGGRCVLSGRARRQGHSDPAPEPCEAAPTTAEAHRVLYARKADESLEDPEGSADRRALGSDLTPR